MSNTNVDDNNDDVDDRKEENMDDVEDDINQVDGHHPNEQNEDERDDAPDDENEDEDKDESKVVKDEDVLNEEESEDEQTFQDESMDNEDEAEDADDHEVKTVYKKAGCNYKKLSASDANFADRVALLLKYSMELGQPNPVRTYVKPNNVRLDDWLHQKYKAGKLSESCINSLSALDVQFKRQRNVVGKQYTVATTISIIHKFEREWLHQG
jgi:hypothetical protein